MKRDQKLRLRFHVGHERIGDFSREIFSFAAKKWSYDA